jgi:biopolymer transport protein ExbD
VKPPRHSDPANDLPDLTPIIDIVFLLIVFFMTVAKMQVQELVEIDVPIAANAVVPEDRSSRVVVTIQNDGALFFGSQAIVVEELTAYVQQARETSPKVKVYIRADARVPFKEVRKLFAAAAAGGVPNVIFASFQSDK